MLRYRKLGLQCKSNEISVDVMPWPGLGGLQINSSFFQVARSKNKDVPLKAEPLDLSGTEEICIIMLTTGLLKWAHGSGELHYRFVRVHTCEHEEHSIRSLKMVP